MQPFLDVASEASLNTLIQALSFVDRSCVSVEQRKNEDGVEMVTLTFPLQHRDVDDISTRESEARKPGLSPREKQIFSLIAVGQTNAAIAFRLGLSEHTVATYIRRVSEKYNLSSRTALVVKLLLQGRISIGDLEISSS